MRTKHDAACAIDISIDGHTVVRDDLCTAKARDDPAHPRHRLAGIRLVANNQAFSVFARHPRQFLFETIILNSAVGAE